MNNLKLRIFVLTSFLLLAPSGLHASENKLYSGLTNELAKNNPDKDLLQGLLCDAIDSNNQETIELFFGFSEKFDVNRCNKAELTPLMIACCADNVELVEKLIAHGADVNVLGIQNKSALICAIIANQPKIAELLMQRGALVNMSDIDGHTPLIYSVSYNNSDIIRMLIDHGADLDVTDKAGLTALMYAAFWGKSSLVELLIKKGADVSVQAKPKLNALSIALHSTTANRQTIKKIVRTILAQNHGAVMQQAYEKLACNSNIKEPADISILQDALQELGLALPPIKVESNDDIQSMATLIGVGTGALFVGAMYGALAGAFVCYCMTR